MDELTLSPEAAALFRARLHLRGGRRRLRQGKYAAGVAALYDALCSGMRWYILVAQEAALVPLRTGVDRQTDREVFIALAQAGVLDNPNAFEHLESGLDQLLNGREPDFEPPEVMTLVEHWLTQLGIMPFDEGALPSEDPRTF